MNIRTLLYIVACLVFGWVAGDASTRTDQRPNVILIMTDDQGYGSVGIHGNPKIKTPHMDSIAREGSRFEYFYVSPVCNPTRAALLTGRYTYRSGMIGASYGQQMIHTDEVTIAEPLRAAGYRTAVFGKWHLGDCYPSRAIDQGFETSLVHRGGMVTKAFYPEPTGNFDPLLERNGKMVRQKGYITDLLTDEAIAFIEAHREEPFFVYLPYNVPHTPLTVPEKYVTPYEQMNLKPSDFPDVGWPVEKLTVDTVLRYAMITCADENIGRLLKRLDELGLHENTIVIFLSDNGPEPRPDPQPGNPVPRYNAGMRTHKQRVYEGGIRVPCFVRWPGRIRAGQTIDRIAAHIDILPTILDACGVPLPKRVKIDGLSLLPLLTGQSAGWPDRTIYIQHHLHSEPVPRVGFCARSQDYKLVRSHELIPGTGEDPILAPLELYDMRIDPLEMNDIAAEHPDIVKSLLAGYDAWFEDVTNDRHYNDIRVVVGTPHENPTMMTAAELRGRAPGLWYKPSDAYWPLTIAADGDYQFSVRFSGATEKREAVLKIQGIERRVTIGPDIDRWTFAPLGLKKNLNEELEAWVVKPDGTGRKQARLVFVERLDL
jgi:arylsulfatase/arylsulfatase A